MRHCRVPLALPDRPTVALWLAALAPLAWIPGGFGRFVFAKLLVVALACMVAGLCAARGRVPGRLWLLVAVGCAIFVVAALAGDAPLSSLVGRWPRYEGLPVLGLYAAAAWLGARLTGPAEEGEDRTGFDQLLDALAWCALLLAAASLLDAVGLSLTGGSDQARSGSLLGNATDQGLVAALLLTVLFARTLSAGDPRLTPLPAAGTAAALLTLGLSGSRTSLLVGLLGAIAVVALAQGRRARLTGAASLALLGGGVGLVLLLPQTRDRLLDSDTVEGRRLLWERSAALVADHPLLGVGPSGFLDAFGRYETREWIHHTGTSTITDSPHSWPLQALVAGGVPMLVAAIAVAAYVGIVGWRATRQRPELTGAYVAVVGYGVGLLANFTSAGPLILAALLVGCVLAEPPGDPWRHALAGPLRHAGVGLAGAAVLGTSMACLAEVQLQRALQDAATGRAAFADTGLAAASRWRPLDSDIALIGAQALAGAANDGDQLAVEPARRWAERALDRTPTSYDARVALAVALLQDGELAPARDLLDDAVASFPQRPEAWLQRGIARFGLRDVAGARADLAEAIAIDPDDPRAPQVLAAIEQRLAADPAAP